MTLTEQTNAPSGLVETKDAHKGVYTIVKEQKQDQLQPRGITEGEIRQLVEAELHGRVAIVRGIGFKPKDDPFPALRTIEGTIALMVIDWAVAQLRAQGMHMTFTVHPTPAETTKKAVRKRTKKTAKKR